MISLALTCLILSFALAGCEAAILSVSRVRVRHRALEGDERARKLLILLEDRDALLGAVTVSNHLSNLVAYVILTAFLVQQFGFAGHLLAFLVGLPVFLIGIEVLPKKWFRRYPFRTLRRLLPLLQVVGWFRALFRPLARTVEAKSEVGTGTPVVLADLMSLVTRLSLKGSIRPTAARLIQNILKYRELHVVDLMTPLRQSVALASDVPVRVGLEFARSHGLVAVPVLGDRGEFIGVFEPAVCGARMPSDRLVRQHMRSLEQVAAGESALRTLQRLRKRGRTVALVLNRDKGPVGVISEEALLRPLLDAGLA